MANAQFLHIFLKPRQGVSEAQIQKKIDLSVDWYKYAEHCYVVKTTSDVAKWQARLKPLVEPSGTLLIMALDVTKRQGWIAQSFWEWLKQARGLVKK